MRHILAYVIASYCLVGCAKHDPKKEIHFSTYGGVSSTFSSTMDDQLTALTTADPLADARVAYKKGDYSFCAVSGFAIDICGINVASTRRLLGPMRRLPYKVISGTSDCIQSDTQGLVNEAATSYAKAYNAQLIMLLATKGREDEPDQRLQGTPEGVPSASTEPEARRP